MADLLLLLAITVFFLSAEWLAGLCQRLRK